jgi:hypothetical protein
MSEASVRVLDGWVGIRDDSRLEVARDKVSGCRDVLCVGDVHVAAGERVFLCVRESGVLIIR